MLRSNSSFKPKTKTINLIFLNGGVGDHVAALSAVQYVKKMYPWITPLVWVPDFLTGFAKHLLPGITVRGYADMKTFYDPRKTTKTTEWDGVLSPMKIHCLDYAFLKLTDENPPIEHKDYLKVRPAEIDTDAFKLPKDYIVLTTGFTAKVREFPAATVNACSAWAKANGLEVVFLGQKQTDTGSAHIIKGAFSAEIDFSVGHNLIDKTTLLQAAKIMGASMAVLGVDNGLLHVAGCTDAYIIGGFTTVSPEIRMPVRNGVLGYNFYPITPDDSLDCRSCQQKTNFLYGHDYTKCIYGDNICVSQMTAEKFIKGLELCL